MTRNQAEILAAILLALLVLLISPGAAITGPVAILALIIGAVPIQRRRRRKQRRRQRIRRA